jgi:hypothetical protein
MGYIPFFIVIAGVIFLVLSLCFHSLRNYRDKVSENLAAIREVRDRIRSEVDEFEFLSVPELESLCDSLCKDLSGNISPALLEEKLQKVNEAFGRLYSGMESKHIQEELLQTINRDVRQIEKLATEANQSAEAYEKLRNENPYRYAAKLFGFGKLDVPAVA